MTELTPPNADPVEVRYWNTFTTDGDTVTHVSHCHILGERLTCCGQELPSSTFGSPWKDSPAYELCKLCSFVSKAISGGASVSWEYK